VPVDCNDAGGKNSDPPGRPHRCGRTATNRSNRPIRRQLIKIKLIEFIFNKNQIEFDTLIPANIDGD
jgi:hypothetical protein